MQFYLTPLKYKIKSIANYNLLVEPYSGIKKYVNQIHFWPFIRPVKTKDSLLGSVKL